MVPSIDTLENNTTGYSNTQYNFITVTCYHDQSAPNAICAGGGDFDQVLAGDANCSGASTNHATVIKDRIGNCFFRKNFGLNGVVDARQCGVYGDGAHDDYAALNTCLQLASSLSTAAPLQNTIHVVTTGGGVILDNTASIEIPANTELTCSGTGTGQAAAPDVDNADDYRILDKHGKPLLTNAIVLAPGLTVWMHHDNVTYSGCTEEAGRGADDDPNPNIYSPSTYYPRCKDTAVPSCTEYSDGPHLRAAVNEYSAFNPHPTYAYPASGGGPAAASIGVTLDTANNLAVRDVMVLGFGTCYRAGNASGDPLPPAGNPSSRLVIDHLRCDGDTGISVDNSPVATQFNGFEVRPFLNSSLGSDASAQTMRADAITSDTLHSTPMYLVYAEVSTGTDPFRFQNGDTVWIATTPYDPVAIVGGAESAAGRWTVSNASATTTTSSPCAALAGFACQTFTLSSSLDQPDSRYNDSSSRLTIGAAFVSNITVGGVPPTAITGISTDPSNADQHALQLVAIGQSISGSCIQSGTAVTDVWPAKGIVYISKPATCASPGSESVAFYDAPFFRGPNCTDSDAPHYNPNEGRYTVNATQRFGDGIVVTNSGGVTAVNCQVYEHLTAFHFSTNANSSRFTNCATGENASLPDQEIIGLKIDGSHDPDPSVGGDACGNEFINGILGQHRTVGILVQSNCGDPNHLSNLRFSGNSGGRRNGIGLELDAGTVALTNSDAFGNDDIFKADATQLYDSDGDPAGDPATATLSIGNNQFPLATLYMSNSAAATSTVGCGNTFLAPTPYLCAPSSFTQPPGGRLTLTQGQPVMSGDVTGTNFVYYAPYVSQQVPIYNTASGLFGLADIGSGIQLKLNISVQLATHLYDIFAEIDPGSGKVRLCTGPAWISVSGGALTRDTSGQIAQINGVWANSVPVSCHYDTGGPSGNHPCLVYECTYLGSIYTTAAGQTSQQFGPLAASGGGGNCLCLYNAYNHVTVTSTSQDNGTAYSYTSTTWRMQRNSTANSVTGIDGLGDMQVSTQLSDAMANGSSASGYVAAFGVDYMFPGGTVVQPVPIVQANSSNKGTYSTTVTRPAVEGIWIARAVEAAVSGSTGSPMFGGAGYQQLGVQVAD